MQGSPSQAGNALTIAVLLWHFGFGFILADFFGEYGTMVGHHGAWSDTMVNVFEQVRVGAGKNSSRSEFEQVRVRAGTYLLEVWM